MAKNRPETPKPTSWNVYKITSKAVWLGELEAPDDRQRRGLRSESLAPWASTLARAEG
jgi:hypothetical protein